MTAASTTPSMSTLRRRAARCGLRVWTPSPRWALEHGPYALLDVEFNWIVASRLDIDELAEAIQAR